MSHTISLDVTGMSCGHCVAAIERAVRLVPGVERAAVAVGRAELTVAVGSDAKIVTASALDAIGHAGYQAVPLESRNVLARGSTQ